MRILTRTEPLRVGFGRAAWVAILVGVLAWISLGLWTTSQVADQFPAVLLSDIEADLTRRGLPISRVTMNGRDAVLFRALASDSLYPQVAEAAIAIPGVRSVRRGASGSGFLSLRWTVDSLVAEGDIPSPYHSGLRDRILSVGASRTVVLDLRQVASTGSIAWQEGISILPSLSSDVPEGVLRFEGRLVSIDGTLDEDATANDVASRVASAFPQFQVVNRLRSATMETRWQALVDEALNGESLKFTVTDRELTVPSREALARVADVLLRLPAARLDIVAHLDQSGDPGIDRRRSQTRARAVKDELTKNGVSEFRLRAIGDGSSNPVSTGNSIEHRLVNRRVELLARGRDG